MRPVAGEHGFTVLELVIVVTLIAALTMIVLPGLRGYATTSAMQTTARQFVSDLRTAQERAIGQGAQVDVAFTVSGGAVTGYTVKQGSTVLWTVTFPSTFPSQVHATSSWPGNDIAFEATGAVTGPGSTPALCVDNTAGLTNTVSITLTTGRAALSSGTGTC